MTAFAQYAKTLVANGMSPIPIVPGEKRPLGSCAFYDHWNELREHALIPRQIDVLARCNPQLGLGVAGGFNCLVPIDFDTDDATIKKTAFSVLPKPTVAKQGKKGGTVFYWDSSGMIEGTKFKARRENGWDMLVEVLVTGQTLLPPTIHPKTMLSYRWLTDATLFNTRIDDLPQISIQHIDDLREVLKPWMPRPEQLTPARECRTDAQIDNQMLSYAVAALKGEARRLSAYAEGRNYGLYLATLRLGKYLNCSILTQSQIEAALLWATQRNGYASARHGGINKALKTVRSALRIVKDTSLPDLEKAA
jgi:hypothetical protein